MTVVSTHPATFSTITPHVVSAWVFIEVGNESEHEAIASHPTTTFPLVYEATTTDPGKFTLNFCFDVR